MNKKLFLVFVLLLGVSSAVFAQVHQIIIKNVGKDALVEGAGGQVFRASISSAVGGSVVSTMAMAGETGLTKNVVLKNNNLKKSTGSLILQRDVKFDGLSDRIRNVVANRMEELDSQTYKSIKESLKKVDADALSWEQVLKLQDDFLFLKENKDLFIYKFGEKEFASTKDQLAQILQKGIDKQLSPVYEQLRKFIGTEFHYPQRGTAFRASLDRSFGRLYAGADVSEQFAYFKYLQRERDFEDGFLPVEPEEKFSDYERIYDFMPVIQGIGELGLPHWDGRPEEKEFFKLLDDAIIFRSVGAPPVHLTDFYSTLENYSAGPAVFEVPEVLQKWYTEQVLFKLKVFGMNHDRLPYFSTQAKTEMFWYGTEELTDEARLHLEVRRALAFPDSALKGFLEAEVNELKALMKSKNLNLGRPPVKY